nr:PREDICTED: L-2-hydroxyglutarate dehydrogenase, mitochondrial isoform X2 [Bemisia tabaci]
MQQAVKGTGKMQRYFDLVIIGGGIVGTALAREMKLRFPSLTMAILEKEHSVGTHQTGHNSGVVHAGIYYKPGSLKARLCVSGMKKSYKYFDEKGIPYKKCGKLIVATEEKQIEKLDTLYSNSLQNGLTSVKMLHGNEIKEVEPYCKGLKALHSPETGIVDWGMVAESYSRDFESAGGTIIPYFDVIGIIENHDTPKKSYDFPVRIVGRTNSNIYAKYVCTCGGLYADKLAMMTGCSPNPVIVPVRGEYLKLSYKKQHLVNGNIYPVPDPRLPFLGVHFTPRMDGSIWVGPNAVLAFRREGYRWWDFKFSELKETLFSRSFQKLAFKYFAFGTSEMLKSIVIGLQVKELQKFIPDITARDISRGPTGVRAQALDINGEFLDDFYFDTAKTGVLAERVIHCRNAPSPAATSSLAIAEHLAVELETRFRLKRIVSNKQKGVSKKST